MRILLDESTPRPLTREFAGLDAMHVADLGWQGRKNGALLAAMRAEGFVVTSGGQVVASCTDLRSLGAEVTHALCVVDRDQGGLGALAAVGVTLVSLFKHEEILSLTG